MADRILELKLISDVSSINKGVQEVNGKLGALEGAVKRVGAAFIAAFAITEVIQFGADAIDMASAVSEATTKLETLLGPHAAIAQSFAEDAASLGLSKAAALEAQGTFAGLFTTLGLGEQEAAKQSAAFTALAADMAAFNNTSVDDALIALQAGLRGESEPLRRFAVLLDDATLKAEALEQGIYNGVGPLTTQQRALAAMGVIFEQTAVQQGNFIATSEELAGSQKVLGAEFANLQLAIGSALLPIMTAFARLLLDEVIPGLKGIWETVGPPLQQLAETLGPKIGGAVERLTALWAALMPHLANLQTIVQPLVDGALSQLNTIFETIIDTIDAVILLLNGDFTGAWNKVGEIIGNFVTMAKENIAAFLGFMSGIVGTFRDVAGNVGSAIFNGISSGINKVVGVVRSVINEVIKALNRINDFAWGRQGFEVNTIAGNFFVGVDAGSIQMWPEIPMLAKGGIVRSPTLAMIGEAGPEAVVPLGHGGGMGSNYTINVNVAPGGDLVQTGRQIVEAIRSYERRSGAVWRS